MNDTMEFEQQAQQLAGVKSSLYVVKKSLINAQKQFDELEQDIFGVEKQLFYDTLMQYGLTEQEILQLVKAAAQERIAG